MKDSQSLKKKARKFIVKKVSEFPKPKLPKRSGEKVIYKKADSHKQESRSKNQETRSPKAHKNLFSGVSSQLSIFTKKLADFRLFTTKNKQADKKPKEEKQKSEHRKPVHGSILKDLESDMQLALIPVILLSILATIVLLNNHFNRVIATNSVSEVESVAEIQPFPLTQTIIHPDISAKAALVLDSNSQVILLSKNPELRFSMASTTKIMTALTALDHFALDELLTVRSYGIEGSGIGLLPGEKYYFKDLLYAMLLPSANDAAVAIADNYPGGREAFVKKMNEKALLLHLTNTHFADPTGLDDDGNYTTVVDLARLGSYAMKDKTFADIAGTREITMYNATYSRQFVLSNLNRLLGVKGVNGVKTGTTEAAGEVLVTSTLTKGHTFIIVVMNSEDRFADTETLLDFIEEKVEFVIPTLP